jgi:predicted NACHT family NTPase
MPEASPDRLEKILGELAAEVESRREDDQTRLAEWFAGVLGHEHTKNERLLAFTEMLRRGHGPGEENEETEETG